MTIIDIDDNIASRGDMQEQKQEQSNAEIVNDVEDTDAVEVETTEDTQQEQREESIDNVFGELDNMTTEELVKLAQLEREDVDNSTEVLLDKPAIVKPDITKRKVISREYSDGSSGEQEQFPVIQRHPKFGELQKTITLSRANGRKWRNLMGSTQKKWYKVSKKGSGLTTKYRFEPYEG